MAAQVRVVIAQGESMRLTDAELQEALNDGRGWDVFVLEDVVLLMAESKAAPAAEGGRQ
jgi:hypothetical protein